MSEPTPNELIREIDKLRTGKPIPLRHVIERAHDAVRVAEHLNDLSLVLSAKHPAFAAECAYKARETLQELAIDIAEHLNAV